MVITGGSPNEECWILQEGFRSFSYQFWSALNRNMDIKNAFKKAKDIMMPRQNALIDANGNDIPNEPDDKKKAEEIKITNGCIIEPTEVIGEISQPQIIDGEISATISIGDITLSHDKIKEVWTEIIPPVNISPNSFRLELQPSVDNTYQLTYDKFTAKGTYTVIFSVRDNRNALYSAATTVTQRQGSPEPEPDSYENDDIYSQANNVVINDKAPQHHTIHKPGDTDWIKFYAYAKQIYRIKVSNLCLICDLIIELYDTDGNTLLISDNDKNREGDNFFEWECPKDGVYYVKIRHSDPDIFGENICYKIEVYRPSLTDIGRVSGTITDYTGNPVIDAIIRTDHGGCACSHRQKEHILLFKRLER